MKKNTESKDGWSSYFLSDFDKYLNIKFELQLKLKWTAASYAHGGPIKSLNSWCKKSKTQQMYLDPKSTILNNLGPVIQNTGYSCLLYNSLSNGQLASG